MRRSVVLAATLLAASGGGVRLAPARWPVAPSAPAAPSPEVRRAVVKLLVRKAAVVAEGVGFAVADDLIVTSRHVVYAAISAEVVLEDRRRSAVREVVAADPYWDLALLRVDAAEANWTPLPLAETCPEEVAVVVPLRFVEDTEGDDDLPLPFDVRRGSLVRRRPVPPGELLVTNLSFDEGDSGSPVFDEAFEAVTGVLTMTTVPITGPAGSFAVPAGRVRAMLDAADRAAPLAESLFAWQRATVDSPEWMIEASMAMGNEPRSGPRKLACDMLEGLVDRHRADDPPTLPREAYYEHAMCLLRRANDLEGDDEEEALREAAAAFLDAERAPAKNVFDDLVLSLALYQRGACLMRLDDPEAARLLDLYVAREPNDPDGHSMRAWIAIAEADVEAAEAAVREFAARVDAEDATLADLRRAVAALRDDG